MNSEHFWKDYGVRGRARDPGDSPRWRNCRWNWGLGKRGSDTDMSSRLQSWRARLCLCGEDIREGFLKKETLVLGFED